MQLAEPFSQFLAKLIMIILFLLLSRPMTAQPDTGKATYVKGMTAMRARALAGVALGLASVLLAWKAKRRAVAQWALVPGIIGCILGIIHLSITAGAVFGSGSGKAGAIVALLLSATGVIIALRKMKT